MFAFLPFKPFEKLPAFDFMAWRRFWVASSVAFVVIVFALLVMRGLNFGIDFVGGKLIQVQTEQSTQVAVIRQSLESAGFGTATIQEYGGDREYLIRLSGNDPKASLETAEQDVRDAIIQAVGPATLERVEFVGPQVGKELRFKGFLAIGLAFAAILIYIWLRFEMRYGVGAIVSLFHDVVLTVGVLALLQTEITLTVLAAILTLIGYSLNDTIVIFDRIRENRGRFPNRPLDEILNMSVNQTMARTIMTAMTTMLVLCAIFFVGGEVIHDFALVLLVGILLGTYSSVFVASPVLLLLEQYYKKQE